jgi:hypothetical protein
MNQDADLPNFDYTNPGNASLQVGLIFSLWGCDLRTIPQIDHASL